MILLIFEGSDDHKLVETALKLFDFVKDKSICVFKGDIYALYSELKSYDIFDGIENSGNTVSILREILNQRGNNELDDISDSDISEIYLFFDYDFHNKRLPLDEINHRISDMLRFFRNETENGKLYLNYPMVEAIRYTKTLPDLNYHLYTIKRIDCSNFKGIAHSFSHYPSMNHLLLSNEKNENEQKAVKRLESVHSNWIHLICMSLQKINYICNGVLGFPTDEIPNGQIFQSQLMKYVCKTESEVSILCSVPLFIYDYFGVKIIQSKRQAR